MEISLNSYGLASDEFYFCQDCINDSPKSKPLWFGIINRINIYTCQSYYMVFQDLTLMKEFIIVYTHPIVIIIKLWPNSSNVSITNL